MRRRPGPPAGSPGAVEVLDEAIHLLRLAPAGALLSFYVGSVPFVLGFLFFWLDRGRITLARRHVRVSNPGSGPGEPTKLPMFPRTCGSCSEGRRIGCNVFGKIFRGK